MDTLFTSGAYLADRLSEQQLALIKSSQSQIKNSIPFGQYELCLIEVDTELNLSLCTRTVHDTAKLASCLQNIFKTNIVITSSKRPTTRVQYRVLTQDAMKKLASANYVFGLYESENEIETEYKSEKELIGHQMILERNDIPCKYGDYVLECRIQIKDLAWAVFLFTIYINFVLDDMLTINDEEKTAKFSRTLGMGKALKEHLSITYQANVV